MFEKGVDDINVASRGLEAALEFHKVGHLLILRDAAKGISIGYRHFLAELLVFKANICRIQLLTDNCYSFIEVTYKCDICSKTCNGVCSETGDLKSDIIGPRFGRALEGICGDCRI